MSDTNAQQHEVVWSQVAYIIGYAMGTGRALHITPYDIGVKISIERHQGRACGKKLFSFGDTLEVAANDMITEIERDLADE